MPEPYRALVILLADAGLRINLSAQLACSSVINGP